MDLFPHMESTWIGFEKKLIRAIQTVIIKSDMGHISDKKSD